MDLLEWIVLIIVASILIPRLLALACRFFLVNWLTSGFEVWLGRLSPRSVSDIRFRFSFDHFECSGHIASVVVRFWYGRKPFSICVHAPSIKLTTKCPVASQTERSSSLRPFPNRMLQWLSLKLIQVLEICVENLSVSISAGDCEMSFDNVNLALRWDIRLLHEMSVIGHSTGSLTGQIIAEITGLQMRLQEVGCFRNPLFVAQRLDFVLDCHLNWLVPTEIVTVTIVTGDIYFTVDPDVDLRLLSKFTKIIQLQSHATHSLAFGDSLSRIFPKVVRVTISKFQIIIVQDVCRMRVTISQVFASCSTIFALVKPSRVDWSLALRGPTIDISTTVRSLLHHSGKDGTLRDSSLSRTISLPFVDCEFTKLSGNSTLFSSGEPPLAQSFSIVIVSPRVFAHPVASVALRYLLERVDLVKDLAARVESFAGAPGSSVLHSPAAESPRRDLAHNFEGTLRTVELNIVNFVVSCYANVISENAAEAHNDLVDFTNPFCRLSFSEFQLKHDLTMHAGLHHGHWALNLFNLGATVAPRAESGSFLRMHPQEYFTHPGQCFAVQTVKVQLGSSNKYEATVSGLFFKWSYLVMAAVGPMMRLVLLVRPRGSSQAILPTLSEPLSPRILVVRVTHLRVDIPFQLELPNNDSDLCLFSYVGPKAKAEAEFTSGRWSVELHDVTVRREALTFMTCSWMRMAGLQPTGDKPELFDIKSRTCRGDWEPALMLTLFKAIKDVVISVVNMKHDIYCVLRSFWPTGGKRMWCRKRPVKSRMINELYAMLAGKSIALEDFLLWFGTTRDPWLPQPFMLISLDAKDTIVRGVVDRYHLSIEIDSFSSSFIPHQWSFLGCRVRYLDLPLLTVDEAHINRIGLTAADVCQNFTEKEHLMMDYLDLNLVFRGTNVVLSPEWVLGSQLEHILPRIMSLVKELWLDLLTLNELSLRHGGPGYTGPPELSPPNITLSIIDFSIVIPENPLEAWLQQLYPLWREERIEQLRREALLEVRLAAGPSKEQAQILQAARDQINSCRYLQRLQTSGLKLRSTTMLEVKIGSISAEMRLDGPHGQFYTRGQVLKMIHDLKLRDRGDKLSLQESAGRSRASESASISQPSQDGPEEDFTEAAGTPPEDWMEDAGHLLVGRGLDMSIEGVVVKLRNFMVPLLTLKTVSMSGCCFFEAAHALPFLTTIPVNATHVEVQKSSGVQILVDLEARVESPVISFAPEYSLALRDIGEVMLNCVPSFSFFAPLIGDSINLLHVARSCLGGRIGLKICHTEVLLFPKSSEGAHMTSCIAGVQLRLDNGLVSVTAKEVTLSIPQKENHPHLLDIPCLELFASAQFSCRDALLKEGAVHVCGLNTSVSVVLPAKRMKDSSAARKGPTVNVHSGSLLWLKKIAQSFGSQLPFPNRNRATRPGVPMVVDSCGCLHFALKTGVPNVEICGVYLERVMVEQVSVTVWEGADLGPARGLNVLLGTVYGSLELVNHGDTQSHTLDEISIDVARQRKLPKAILIGGQKRQPLEILDEKSCPNGDGYYLVRFQPPHVPEWCSKQMLCEHLQLLRVWAQASQGVAPLSPPKQRWGVSNVVAGLAKMKLTIVENQKWTEAFDQARRHLSALSSSNSAVVHTYENQRWALRKWSKANMLPTDRPPWSNKEGTIGVPRNSCMLPDGWEWESDWQLDHQLRATGQEVDEEGWEYAMDFQRSWSGSAEWYSHVRRRRWIRIRRLKGTSDEDVPVIGPQKSSSIVAALESFELNQKRSWSIPNTRREMFREATRFTVNLASSKDTFFTSSLADDITLTDFFRVEKLFTAKISERNADTEDKSQRGQRKKSITSSCAEMHSVQIESFRLVVNLEIRGIAVALIKQYTSILHQDDSLPESIGKRRQDSEPAKPDFDSRTSMNMGRSLPVQSSVSRRDWSATNPLKAGSSSEGSRNDSKMDWPSTPTFSRLRNLGGPITENSLLGLTPTERSVTAAPLNPAAKVVHECMVEGAQGAMFEIRLRDAQVSIDAEDQNGRIVVVVQEQAISGRIGSIEAADISPEPTQSALENMETPLDEEEEDSQGQLTISRLMDPQSQSKLDSVTSPPKRTFDADEMMSIAECIPEEESTLERESECLRATEETDQVAEVEKKPQNRVLLEHTLTAQVFIARSDVDVRVGRVWLQDSTLGLFQAIMAPLRVNARVVWFMEKGHSPILTVNIPLMKLFLDSAQFGLMTGVLASALAPLLPDAEAPFDTQLSQRSTSQLRKEALHVGRVLSTCQWQLRCLQDILPGGEISARDVDDDEEQTRLSPEDSVTWDLNKGVQAKLGQKVSQLTNSCSEASSRRAALVLTLKSRCKPALPSLPGGFVFGCKVQLEKYEFDLMRNGVVFVSLYVQGTKISGGLNAEMSMTFSLEIKSFGARKLDKSQDNKWIEMITQCKLNEKDKSDSWTDASTTISLRTAFQFYQHPPHALKALSHVDVNVFPLSFRISSDTVTAVSAFIFNEDAKRETHKFQKSFLPASHTLLEIDVPSAFEIRNLAPAMKPKTMGNLKDRFGKRDRRASEDDPDLAEGLPQEDKQRMSLATLARKIWNWNAQPDNQQARFEVTHFRVGRTYFILNYTGKKEHSNVEDIQGLRITLKGFLYQKKTWSGQQLLRRLRKDLIYGMLRQTGETLSEFLSYKLGLRKNDDSDSEDEERYPHLPTSHEESRTLLFGDRHKSER